MLAASEYGSPSERFTAVQLIITLRVSFSFAIVTTMPKPNFKDRIDRTFSTLNIVLSPATCSLLQEKCSLSGDTLDEQADEGYVVLQAVLTQLAKNTLPDASGGDLSVGLHSDRKGRIILVLFLSRLSAPFWPTLDSSVL